MQITTLASLKRAISTPGVNIQVVAHWQPHLRDTSRVPSKVQTNGYFYPAVDRDGKQTRFWCETPKASQLRFNPDGTVTYYPDTEKSWTLRFEVPA